MNINKLKESNTREFKNYKELCSILNVEILAGNSKKSQLKEFERFCAYHKEGNKFVIDEIYEIPKRDDRAENQRKGTIIKNINKGNYSKEMFPLVKNFVGINNIEYASKTHLMESLNLKNKNYDIAYMNIVETAKALEKEYKMGITEEDIKTITTSMWSVSQDKIDKAFKNLEKLKYIYDYDNKLLCIYNSDTNSHEVVIRELEGFTKFIYEGKLKALADYFVRNPKKDMSEYVELVNYLSEGLDITKHEDILEISCKLNQELYLRGLGEKGRKESLNIINKKGYSNVKTFYYAYSYMRNEDIEWKNEILEEAKKQIHIGNFKKAVKNDYILDTFLERWFVSEEKKIDTNTSSDTKKRIFKDELKKHKKNLSEKYDLLFDILVSDNTDIDLKQLIDKHKKNEIATFDKEEVLPF